MSDDEKQTEAATPPGEKAPTSGIEVMDDARTRALTEALQSSFKVVRVIMVILAVAFFGSGITKINNNKQALHLRFGKYKETLQPGLVWAWPYPIDEIVQSPSTKTARSLPTLAGALRMRKPRRTARRSSRLTTATPSPATATRSTSRRR